MIDLKGKMNFRQFLNSSNEEFREEQLKLYNIDLFDASKDIIMKVERAVELIVFSEIYCPDCRIVMPYLKKIEEINDNIEISIYPREGNEKAMKDYVGIARIPTVIKIDNKEKLEGRFIEFPKEISETLDRLTEEEREEVIDKYRRGEYNELIEKDLINKVIL
ncbi:thioredoxin family protein [Halonatronum saccharophilum]|uniref:thioredoxin family protein n=1 Tax=Halonatronum saccharophilum TaxID=150060 RepID=UPI0004829870|nr:thioredoxin family protein [Halonatronum saccharophilum]